MLSALANPLKDNIKIILLNNFRIGASFARTAMLAQAYDLGKKTAGVKGLFTLIGDYQLTDRSKGLTVGDA